MIPFYVPLAKGEVSQNSSSFLHILNSVQYMRICECVCMVIEYLIKGVNNARSNCNQKYSHPMLDTFYRNYMHIMLPSSFIIIIFYKATTRSI